MSMKVMKIIRKVLRLASAHGRIQMRQLEWPRNPLNTPSEHGIGLNVGIVSVSLNVRASSEITSTRRLLVCKGMDAGHYMLLSNTWTC